MASLKFLGANGHTTVEYDVLDEASVVAARAAFETAIQEGKTAFATTTPGQPAEVARTFDPQVEEYVILAPMAGGAR